MEEMMEVHEDWLHRNGTQFELECLKKLLRTFQVRLQGQFHPYSMVASFSGPFSGLTIPVFLETMCTHLCLQSLACSDKLEEAIGREYIVDIFGDRVNAATLHITHYT